MADYVLVHGAWCGAWSYDRLASELRATGHNVLVADLTGLGNRKEELHAGITLSTHIDDVVQQIEASGFERFILAGHSYGGMVVAGVAARLGARIDALVYIDGFLPSDGQSLWDLTSAAEHELNIDLQRSTPGLVAPLPFFPDTRLTHHPYLAFIEPVWATGEEQKVGRKIYIFASAWDPSPFAKFVPLVSNAPGWEYHDFPCGHFVMEDMPERLLEVMLGCTE